MEHDIKSDRLIIPVYINEKIVLDMLAIIEDGFSMVSQINYTEHTENNSVQKADAEISTSTTLLSKLLKIDVSGGLSAYQCFPFIKVSKLFSRTKDTKI